MYASAPKRKSSFRFEVGRAWAKGDIPQNGLAAMHNLIWPALLTFGAGVSVLVQQALNANLRAELNSTAWSGFMSYFLGVVFMVCLAATHRDPVPTANT